jgi:hypothetical protein
MQIYKKYLLCFFSFVLLLVASSTIRTAQAQTLIDTTTATGISNTIDSGPAVNAPAIRDRIRADLDAKMQNARTNQEVRNQMLENGYKITSTTPARPPLKNPPKLEKQSSTTPAFLNQRAPQGLKEENRLSKEMERKELEEKEMERKNEGRAFTMALDLLKNKKDTLGKQLDVALKNLVDLRKRIGTRIEKDRNAGKDLSTVTPLLKIADTKLMAAKQAVDAVKNYKPENSSTSPASSQNASTSQSNRLVDLKTIRTLVDKAQMAIKDAHKALNDVVVAIAKISGNREDKKLPASPSATSPANSPTLETTNQ